MSEKIPVWTWRHAIQQTKVPSLTKLVCYEIANWLSDAGKGWHVPSADIQKNTGLSNRTVATHLQNAADAGLLSIVRKLCADGRYGVTHYVPRFPDNMDLAREPAEFVDGSPREGGSHGQPREGGSRGPREPDDKKPPSPREGGSRLLIHTDPQEKSSQERARKRASSPRKPGSSSGKSAKRKLTALPDDFDPTELMAFAAKLGLPESEIHVAVGKWKCDRLGKGARRADWTKDGQGYLLSWANNLKKDQANGKRRAPANTDDAFSMAERGGLN